MPSDSISSPLDFLIANAIRHNDPTACMNPDLLGMLAQVAIDGNPEIAENARIKFKSHYGNRLDLTAWKKCLRTAEVKIKQGRAEEAARKRAEEAPALALPDGVTDPRGYVLAGLRKVIERCMQAEPVMDRDGVPTGQFNFQAVAATRAFELYGKEHGMFIDRSKIDLGIKDALERASGEDISAMLQEMEQRRTAALAARSKDQVQ